MISTPVYDPQMQLALPEHKVESKSDGAAMSDEAKRHTMVDCANAGYFVYQESVPVVTALPSSFLQRKKGPCGP